MIKQLIEFCKHFPAAPAAVAAAALVLSGFVWLAQPRFDEYLDNRHTHEYVGGPCVTFPVAGHRAVAAAPGEWTTIYWNDLVKLRDDCGQPHVTGVITNGGGLYHDAELSISGIIVPLGTFSMSYQFFVEDRVEEGSGRFRVTVTYPDAINGAPPAISPWVPFTILAPTEE